jgi:hypothetical protein
VKAVTLRRYYYNASLTAANFITIRRVAVKHSIASKSRVNAVVVVTAVLVRGAVA